MAAKQPVAPPQDSVFASHVAGMSKNKLYDIMSRMKSLMEQNHQQAKQILVENPALTKSLFQTTNSQQTLPQPSGQADQKPNVPSPQSMHIDTGVHEEAGGSQRQPAVKQELQPSASLPPLDFQSQAVPSSSVPSSHQGKGALNIQMPPISLGHNSQIHNVPPMPPPLQRPPFQLHAQVPSSQMHHSVPAGKVIHQPLQAPMLSNIRPPLQQFPHQLHTQTSHNIPFHPSTTNPQLISQPMYQLGSGPPTSFPQGQPPLPVQPPPQHLYQGGSQVGMDYGSQTAKPMQVDRVAPWAHGPPENTMLGSQFAGPPPPQMNPGQPSQAPRLPQLRSEMEKALLQQVMSLTPE